MALISLFDLIIIIKRFFILFIHILVFFCIFIFISSFSEYDDVIPTHPNSLAANILYIAVYIEISDL